MNKNLSQRTDESLMNDQLTVKKLQFNFKKNREQDQTEALDTCARNFNYEACKNQYWNIEECSLLYATPLWQQATEEQKILLNQLYWVAYYAQIISAEIATIFFNQTASAGLYGIEDFRLVCETLDFESMQERAHIDAFKKISEEVEEKLFGKRLFTYSMRPYFHETMIYQDTNKLRLMWKRFQLQSYALLSSSNAFIASQYLTVRGLRTLNGKMIQHKLSQFSLDGQELHTQPIPSQVSYHHFLDESFHFNSSHLIGSEVVKTLKKPTKFEAFVANMGVAGSLKDHSQFNICVNGIFWYEPALFQTIYELLRTPYFNFSHSEALDMMRRCFCEENEAIHRSFSTHQTAKESYIQYLHNLSYINPQNLAGGKMQETSIAGYLHKNRLAFDHFSRKKAA